MLKIIVADDHKMFRAGLKSLLESESGVKVIGEAGNGRDLVKMALEKKPDVVVIDISMPDLNGIEATRQLTAAGLKTRIIGLSMHADVSYVRNMLQAGASGYMLKDCAYDELSTAIRMVSANQTYLSPQIADVIAKDYLRHLSSPKESHEDDSPAAELSSREREVLQLIAEGKPTREIAEILNVSIKTVETHRKQIMNKLNMHSIAELTKYAIRKGLTSLE